MNRILILLIVIPTLAFGQFKDGSQPISFSSALKNSIFIGKSAMNLIGLDPSRLNMSQSYQMSYMSMGDQGTTQGVYLNTLSYSFSSPLTLAFQWGIAHQPFPASGNAPFLQNGPFLSGAILRYEPFKNTVIHIEYSRNPYNNYYGMNPWWRRR